MAGEAVATHLDWTQLAGHLWFSDQLNFLLSKATSVDIDKTKVQLIDCSALQWGLLASGVLDLVSDR